MPIANRVADEFFCEEPNQFNLNNDNNITYIVDEEYNQQIIEEQLERERREGIRKFEEEILNRDFDDFGENDSFRFHISEFYYYVINMMLNMSDLQFESKINHLEFIFDNLDRYINRKFENENREIKNFRDIYENEVLNLYDEN